MRSEEFLLHVHTHMQALLAYPQLVSKCVFINFSQLTTKEYLNLTELLAWMFSYEDTCRETQS